MKNLLSLLFVIPLLMNGQNGYKAISNIVNTNTKADVLDIGLTYEFDNKQGQIIYNLSNRLFVFGTHNQNNATIAYRTLFGSQRQTDILNTGYSLGTGLLNIINFRDFKNTELLLGFESQKFETKDYSIKYNPEEKKILRQNYFKIFTQFNIMRAREKYDFGYSLKLSYFKITSYKVEDLRLYKFDLINDFTGKSTFMLDPTLNFNYKMLKNRNLLFVSQIGFSSALWPISDKQTQKFDFGGESSSNLTQFYFSPILKIGIQYRINLKKSEQ